MADTSVPISAGVGTAVATFINAASQNEQYVRVRAASATTLDEWTVSTTGVASRIAADVTRVGMLMVNGSSGRVYLRFDNTIPAALSYGWFLESGDRWEVPAWLVQRAVSVLGTVTNGELYTTLATAV